MVESSLEVSPTSEPRRVRAPDGRVLEVPPDWALLPPGDAALTRRVKQAGPSWAVHEMRGRKRFSRGVWAPAATIERLTAARTAEREDPRYVRTLERQRERRAAAEGVYAEDFEQAVIDFLAFAPRYRDLARRLAAAVTRHATPVGSGTVARTRRIPLPQRAEAAVIAWLRHQTTGYDDMHIPRVKGMRREVRRMLAERSRALLQRYRSGAPGPDTCPLRRALGGGEPAPASTELA